ncbi:hypothetical protein K443DRAFT_581423 [Laccaria amethystina LaAM-08-1]|uniref:Uncharacterized protein n=1 Tax=Laccaria amethystina LaAM-08-1 TaxID=1095629 RepID=A0A0C9XHP6_9AGAR|nr:hypothetical protein K443DRAFT_581423 [Laccaria amethystina LaAM-08-1]
MVAPTLTPHRAPRTSRASVRSQRRHPTVRCSSLRHPCVHGKIPRFQLSLSQPLPSQPLPTQVPPSQPLSVAARGERYRQEHGEHDHYKFGPCVTITAVFRASIAYHVQPYLQVVPVVLFPHRIDMSTVCAQRRYFHLSSQRRLATFLARTVNKGVRVAGFHCKIIPSLYQCSTEPGACTELVQ